MKCLHCSMEGIYKQDKDGATYYYCEHHIPQEASNKSHSLNRLAPLFAVFAGIIAVSLYRQVADGPNLMMWMMDFMGVFLVTFGVFKLFDLKSFVVSFRTYDLLAKRFKAYAYAFPFIEIGLGVMYLMGMMYWWQNTLALLIAVVGAWSAVLVLQNKDKAEETVCVCLGTVFKLPMTWVTFLENALMGLMVLWMFLL